MNSAIGWMLGVGFLIAAILHACWKIWPAFGVSLGMSVIAFALLLMKVEESRFELLMNSILALTTIAVGGFLWTEKGGRWSVANGLSTGGAKAFGTFIVIMGLAMAAGLFLSAIGL